MTADYGFLTAQSFAGTKSTIETECPNDMKEKDVAAKMKQRIVPSFYTKKIKTLAWFDDIQRCAIHHKLAVIEKHPRKETLRQAFREIYQSKAEPPFFSVPKATIDLLHGFTAGSPDMQQFPMYSFRLAFEFVLAKPYLSKDDDPFYLEDNPIKKEHVFKVPMVSSSTWKGNLRWSAVKLFENGLPHRIPADAQQIVLEKRAALQNLFGHETEKVKNYLDGKTGGSVQNQDEASSGTEDQSRESEGKSASRKGRLTFFPTFFDRIGLEVFNPHKRSTRKGTIPVVYESVPAESTGTFQLLYLPFDLIGKKPEDIAAQVAADLAWVGKSLTAMFLLYGFSAKKSLDYGIAQKTFPKPGRFEMAGKKFFTAPSQAKEKKDNSNPFSKLQNLNFPVEDNAFNDFDGLKKLLEKASREIVHK